MCLDGLHYRDHRSPIWRPQYHLVTCHIADLWVRVIWLTKVFIRQSAPWLWETPSDATVLPRCMTAGHSVPLIHLTDALTFGHFCLLSTFLEEVCLILLMFREDLWRTRRHGMFQIRVWGCSVSRCPGDPGMWRAHLQGECPCERQRHGNGRASRERHPKPPPQTAGLQDKGKIIVH